MSDLKEFGGQVHPQGVKSRELWEKEDKRLDELGVTNYGRPVLPPYPSDLTFKNAFYLPSGRVFLLETGDGYPLECTEMRDVSVGGKQHQEVRTSLDPHIIWKHLVSYRDKWLLTVSTQKGCVHNCEFCSPEGTKVNTPNGPKNIESLETGDLVIGHDGNKPFVNKINETFNRNYEGELICIHLENGEVLKLTPNHEVFTNNGLKKASDLTEDDDLIDF